MSRHSHATVHNLEVDGFQTYSAGSRRVWVHNVSDLSSLFDPIRRRLQREIDDADREIKELRGLSASPAARLPGGDRFLALQLEELYRRLEGHGRRAAHLQRWGERRLREAPPGNDPVRKDALEMKVLGDGLVRWVKDLREEIVDLEYRLSL